MSSFDNPETWKDICYRCDCNLVGLSHHQHSNTFKQNLNTLSDEHLHVDTKKRRGTLTRHDAVYSSGSESVEIEQTPPKPMLSINDFMPTPNEQTPSDESEIDIPYMKR